MQRLFVALISLLMLAPFSMASRDSTAELKLDVQTFQLKNGMQFIVVNRPATPQVAVRLAIRAGSALEETGKTGIAHLLEHMMFKGTKNVGTTDWQKDEALQNQIEAAYQTVLKEQRKRKPDKDLIEKKQAEMETLRQEVLKLYIPQAFSSQLGKNGAVGVNAFTSKDQTQYIGSVPSDMLEQWFSIISEQVFEPSWREFYVEKSVVQREWAFRYVNNPNGAAWLDLNAAAYTAHPYRNPTIGWRADMEDYNTSDAVAFHKRYYNPTNAVVVLVGDVTVDTARRLARIYFERYPAGQPSPESVTAEPVQMGPRRHVRYLKGARTPLVRIGFHGARMGTPDFYALDTLTMILSYGLSARMTQNVIQKGLAVDAWAYNPDNRYGGMVVVGGSPIEPDLSKVDPSDENAVRLAYLQACEKLEGILLEEIERLKIDPVSDRELARIKKMNQRDFIDRMRTNENLAGTLATLEVQVGWQYLNGYLKNMANVSPEDVLRVAQKYFRTENQTTVYVIPGGRPEAPPQTYSEVRSMGMSAARQQTTPQRFDNHSIYPTPSNWKHPLAFDRKPTQIKYPRARAKSIGQTPVYYLPDPQLPLVDLTLLVKAGEVDVEPTLHGLADLLGDTLMRGGTVNYSPQELALILDENAIQMSLDIRQEYTSIKLSVMKSDWQKGLELLTEVLTRPRFDQKVFRIAKTQAITALKRQGGDAQAVAAREATIWRFGQHPYGRDPLLGLDTIDQIQPADLKQFVETYFVPANIVATVAGDISEQEALSGLRKLLSALPQKEGPKRQLPDPDPTEPVLALIHKPGQVQSQVIINLPGPKRTQPEYWTLRLLMDIFGGNDSLMYTRLRDDLGLVYSAGFYQTFKWQAGMLVGYIGCKADKTRLAIADTVRLMESLHNDIPQTEFELKRLDALNSFVFNVDTPVDLVNVYGQYHLRGEPLDTLERIQEAYLNADRQTLRQLAKSYLDPSQVQIFVVADKDTMVKAESGGRQGTLEEDLKQLAAQLKVSYREIALR